MKYVVRASPHALLDIRRLADFLAPKSQRAADRAMDAIELAIASLAEYPERGRPGPIAGARELPVPFGRDGYVLRYRVKGSEVIILRIFHSLEER